MQKILPCKVNSSRKVHTKSDASDMLSCSILLFILAQALILTRPVKDCLLIFLGKYFLMSVFTLILVLLLVTVEVKMEKQP